MTKIRENIDKLFFRLFGEFSNPQINDSKIGYYTTDTMFEEFKNELLSLFEKELEREYEQGGLDAVRSIKMHVDSMEKAYTENTERLKEKLG